MILTIALNPSVNRYIQLEDLTLNKENSARGDVLAVGDCGVYSAYVMKMLQGDPYVMGVSGGIGGRFIRNFLNKNRIKSDFLQVERETRSRIVIEHGHAQETSIVSHNDTLTQRDYINIRHKLYNHLVDTELIAVTGNDFYTIDVIKDIHEMTKDSKRILIGAEGEALKAAMTGSVFGVVLNTSDLENLGLPSPNSEDAMKTLMHFQKNHKIKYMIIESNHNIYGFIRNKICRIDWTVRQQDRIIIKSLLLGGLAISIKRKYPFEKMMKILGAIGSQTRFNEYPFVLQRKDVERQCKRLKLHEIYNHRNGFFTEVSHE